MKKDWYKRMARIAVVSFITGFVKYFVIALHYMIKGFLFLLGLLKILCQFQHHTIYPLLPYHQPIKGRII